MKPINLGSLAVYVALAPVILGCASILLLIGPLPLLICTIIIGLIAIALLVHSAIVLMRTSSDTDRRVCKVNILFSCLYVAMPLIPFAVSLVIGSII